MTSRLRILKTVLWAFVGVLAVVTVARFARGLGATTNLSDTTPWGLWIAFDVMAGVALAAGGFVLAATVYIFGLERYRPFVRPAILTAFLGYAAVAVGLLYDLGLPWHIWHPMILWQHHSVLFEVAMCVMFYLTVLALEFAPVVLEHPLFDKPLFRSILALLKKVTIFLVIAGIILSTLHQSSLGSLFLIAPHRVHPLWYSPIMYLLFFISAIGLGLMTVTLESLLSGYFFHHKVDTGRLSGLGVGAAVVLGLYALIRVGDLAFRGVLGHAVDGSWQGALFLFELAISAVVPALLLSLRSVRTRVAGLAVCATMTVLGIVFYRINVCIVAFAQPEGWTYVPSWMEVAVSVGIVSAACLVFIFFVENLKVYDPAEEGHAPAPRMTFANATMHWLAPYNRIALRQYSLAFVAAAALAVTMLPRDAVFGPEPLPDEVTAARSVDGFIETRDGKVDLPRILKNGSDAPAGAKPTLLMTVDGNRNGEIVLFAHRAHAMRLGGKNSCAVCHHLNMPFDKNSSCHECHRDMREATSIFSHTSHVEKLHGNQSCAECHTAAAAVKTYDTATSCDECHADMRVEGTLVKSRDGEKWRKAVGYMDAMHGLCILCHEEKEKKDPDAHAGLSQCAGCHQGTTEHELRKLAPQRRERAKVAGRHVEKGVDVTAQAE